MNKTQNILIVLITISKISCSNLQDLKKECQLSDPNGELQKKFSSASQIGMGTFGIVKKLELDGKEVVIKKIKIKTINVVNALFNEIIILKKVINQDNLLNFYKCVFDESESTIYIFTELLQQDLLNDDKFRQKPQKDKIDFYIKLAEAIKSFHDLNFSHNDIKPANIMIKDDSYFPKLIDFGLATELGKKTEGGSELYMPFEKIGTSINSTKEMDIVSFGVTIVELETNQENLMTIYNEQNIKYKNKEDFLKSYHIELARSVGPKYIFKLADHNFIVKTFKFFAKDIPERVYSFKDLLKGLMENNIKKRLTIEDAIGLLKRFKKIYEVNNEEMQNNNKIDEDKYKTKKIDENFFSFANKVISKNRRARRALLIV